MLLKPAIVQTSPKRGKCPESNSLRDNSHGELLRGKVSFLLAIERGWARFRLIKSLSTFKIYLITPVTW